MPTRIQAGKAPSKLLPEAPAWDCGELPSSQSKHVLRSFATGNHLKQQPRSAFLWLATSSDRSTTMPVGFHHQNFAWCCAHILGIRTPGGKLAVCEGDQHTGTIKNPRKICLIPIAFTCYNVVSEACDQHHCLSVAFVNGSQLQLPLDVFAGQCCFPEDSSISLQQIQVPRLKKVSPPFI